MVKPPEIHINYPKLVDNAMRDIAKKLLKSVENEGLRGDHYFLISFVTTYSGVTLSERLKRKYNPEMTIVIQHQYENMFVNDEELAITLSFDGIKEDIIVPFNALTSFVDPSTRFALQFNPELADIKPKAKIYKLEEVGRSSKEETKAEPKSQESKVLVLDNFRKK